eukprot:CAMPEP_0204448512 /NCGR_PEP_ID=MMETSP0470-20130426/98534_1 /ASSEMBLY_ACC=CAM_ASM_000385 /TAXON_ID=2969 /ORGANISM="Oxyrrhis marina" /LENGTH=61 /DNA_ID=CAMNT_0051448261 /DNA_START=149 /DNA_END=331 /DNA_ORIENTATION=+
MVSCPVKAPCLQMSSCRPSMMSWRWPGGSSGGTTHPPGPGFGSGSGASAPKASPANPAGRA